MCWALRSIFLRMRVYSISLICDYLLGRVDLSLIDLNKQVQ